MSPANFTLLRYCYAQQQPLDLALARALVAVLFLFSRIFFYSDVGFFSFSSSISLLFSGSSRRKIWLTRIFFFASGCSLPFPFPALSSETLQTIFVGGDVVVVLRKQTNFPFGETQTHSGRILLSSLVVLGGGVKYSV